MAGASPVASPGIAWANARVPVKPKEKHALSMNNSREEYDEQDEEEGLLYEHRRLEISAHQRPMRLDNYLVQHLGVSRTQIQKAIVRGEFRVNEQVVKPSHRLVPFAQVQLLLPYPPLPEIEPHPMPLDILYEDDDLLVLNKPPYIACHPGPGPDNVTLFHGLLAYFARLIEQQQLPADARPRFPHRLDRDTSGLLVVAKQLSALQQLGAQFASRQASRLYDAVVWGDLRQYEGHISGHIGHTVQGASRWAVFADGSHGRPAVTHYSVWRRYEVATWIQCRLETGRTHQIRLHCQHIGHPVLGDRIYGGNPLPLWMDEALGQALLEVMPRQALHASSLSLIHPRTQQMMHWECPLPADIRALLDMLDARA